MAKKVYRRVKPYFYLIPVIFLFAVGILFRSAQRVTLDMTQNACGCDPTNISGEVEPTANVAYFEGKNVTVPSEQSLNSLPVTKVLGLATPSEKWIEVDLSEQKLKAWDGTKLYLESPVSTGLPGYDTPIGEFHIWMKIRATRMKGGEGRLAYDLPNVPYVMFFSNDQVAPYKGYGLHGTYWHNDFGRVHSHGCVNLPTPVAKSLYEWTTPTMPDGVRMLRSDDLNPGTRIVIHE